MAYIRDNLYQVSTSSGTSAYAIKCNVVAGDLLLMIVQCGTAALGITTPSGWNLLFTQTGSVDVAHTAVFWRIATGSEPVDELMNVSGGSTTYQTTYMAIADVDTTYPFGNPAVYTITSPAGTSEKYTMPTLTTTRNNALVLYFSSRKNSSTNQVAYPAIIQGGVTSIPPSVVVQATSNTASFSLAYTKKTTSGTTESNIYAVQKAITGNSANGFDFVLQIQPPSGGESSKIPFCLSDTCEIYDPISSNAVDFNGNARLLNAGTNFGSPNYAPSLTATASIGMFSGRGQVQMSVTSNQFSCAEITFPSGSKPNWTNKNILLHWRAVTPMTFQKLEKIASGRGLCLALRSAAGANYKSWRVLTSESQIPAAAYYPVVINPSASATYSRNNGTLDASAVEAIGFIDYPISPSTQANWAMLWVMGVTTIVGGDSSNVIDLLKIEKIVASGHERKTAIIQGAAQMLLLQEIQIGDGGNNPTYLKIEDSIVEFPSQYNETTKNVSYNSIDNAVGLKYYAGASDTIIHRNSVISSPSRYFWGLHSSSSVSASYDFSGLSVIGAGTITLARAITITNLTIDDYSTLDLSGLTLQNSSIKNIPAGNDSATLSASTNIDYCDINVSGVTAGNRWCSVADPSIFTYCDFVGGGGHAIRVTSPGAYTFTGNTFTGFGVDGSTGAAIFNDSGGAVTINIAGGGSTPSVKNGTGASTTVNNNKTLTLTGLISGSDIVILTAGTTTERVNVDAYAGTNYNFSYLYTANDYVDITVYKQGYAPFAIRNYLLANADGSVPISQVSDRNFNNP